jgi:hypothetical protein
MSSDGGSAAGAGRSALAGVEQAYVRMFVAVRALDLGQAWLAVALGCARAATRPGVDVALIALATLESLWLCWWFLRRRSLLPAGRALALDCCFAVAMLLGTMWYTPTGDRTSTWLSWAFAFTLSTAGLAGASLRRPGPVAVAALVLAAVYAGVTAVPNLGAADGAVATGLVNASAYPAFAGVMWLVSEYIRNLAGAADDARLRVAQLERDRAHGVIHEVLPYLRVDALLQADPAQQVAIVTDTLAKFDQLRAYVDGTDQPGDVEGAVRNVAGLFASMDLRIVNALDHPVILDEDVAFGLRQALETALANARANAPQARVVLTVGAQPDTVFVTVVDDGDGFDPAQTRPGFGMSETLGRQLAAIGGRGQVTSTPGTGTTVQITVPREVG